MASKTSGKWLVTAGLVVVAFAIGASAMWLLQASVIQSLEERLAYYEQAGDDASAAEDGVGNGSTEPTGSTGNETDGSDAGNGDGDGDGAAEGDQTAGTETVPAFVTSVRVAGGVTYVTLDYIQFLTGPEAADAAAARGDESPPPNDYYIVNDNPQLREYPVREGITVQVMYTADQMSVPEGVAIPLAEWTAGMTGSMQIYYTSTYYIVTVTDGTIAAIDQQYLP